MNNFIQKFITYLILAGLLSVGSFFLIRYYDDFGTMINWIDSNKSYLIFLILSIVVYFSLRGNNKVKSKFINHSLIFVNFLYLCFLFLVGNIGLTWIQALLLIGLLILGGACFYLKNVFGYIVFSLCSLGCIIILYFSIIPLYENGPDMSGFEKNFNTKLLIYSNTSLNENHALIDNSGKKYLIYEGLSVYDLKLKNNSQIVFKSDDLYQNTFGFIVFYGGEFIQLNPQSAINITNSGVEILAGNVEYYPKEPKYFSFDNIDENSLVGISSNYDIVNNWYDNNLKLYFKNQIGGNIFINKTMIKISKYTLLFLNKLFFGKYENNLNNLDKYIDIFDINLENNGFLETNLNIKYDRKNNLNGLGNGLKNGIDNTKDVNVLPGRNTFNQK